MNSIVWKLLLEQIKAVEAERDVLLAVHQGAAPAPAAMLLNIKGIGPRLPSSGRKGCSDTSTIDARRLRGPSSDPESGSVDREQGVSKAGNPRLRTTLIQLTWLWLRNQPQSALALWFKERVNQKWRLSQEDDPSWRWRKLLVALWKYVTAGVVIEGAIVKSAPERRSEEIEVIYRDPTVSADPGGRTEPVRGLKSRYQEGSRPPGVCPPWQAGYWQPLRAATECEVDLVRKTTRSWKRAQTLIPKQRPEFHLCATGPT